MRTIAITGAGGLLGFHLRARIQAHEGKGANVIPIHRESFDDEAGFARLVADCDSIVHLAYLIGGPDHEVLRRNREVAERLTAAVDKTERPIRLVFASSTHIDRDTVYGASKRECDAFFASWAERRAHAFTSLVLPHVFGEGGRPFHNSVVSTFCHKLARGEVPEILSDSSLELLHAQSAAAAILRALEPELGGGAVRPGQAQIRVSGKPLFVSELLDLLSSIDREYRALLLPDLEDPLRLDLFNTYRSYLFPSRYPVSPALREDARGSLFEAVRSIHGGQAFLSTTRPGITRGNHFHIRKVERFCVVRGSASIRIRKLFSSDVIRFDVSGARPQYIDIPTLHTHNIINTGDDELLTLFWAHEIFDPKAPDTYSEPV